MLHNSCWSAGCAFHFPPPSWVQLCNSQFCVSKDMIWIWLQRASLGKHPSNDEERSHRHTCRPYLQTQMMVFGTSMPFPSSFLIVLQSKSPEYPNCSSAQCGEALHATRMRRVSAHRCWCRCTPIFLKSGLTNGTECLNALSSFSLTGRMRKICGSCNSGLFKWAALSAGNSPRSTD